MLNPLLVKIEKFPNNSTAKIDRASVTLPQKPIYHLIAVCLYVPSISDLADSHADSKE
jgi:hypothetical protein